MAIRPQTYRALFTHRFPLAGGDDGLKLRALLGINYGKAVRTKLVREVFEA